MVLCSTKKTKITPTTVAPWLFFFALEFLLERLFFVLFCFLLCFLWCGPFLKSLVNLLQYSFCFMFRFFLPQGMRDLNLPTRDWTCIPCIGRWSLNHRTAREVPGKVLVLILALILPLCVSCAYVKGKLKIKYTDWGIHKTSFSECNSYESVSDLESVIFTFCCAGLCSVPSKALVMEHFLKGSSSTVSRIPFWVTSHVLCQSKGSDNCGQLLVANGDGKMHFDFRNIKMWVKMCLFKK